MHQQTTLLRPHGDEHAYASWEKQQQESDHPVANAKWNDVPAYAQWLAQVTEQPYRLPTEQAVLCISRWPGQYDMIAKEIL